MLQKSKEIKEVRIKRGWKNKIDFALYWDTDLDTLITLTYEMTKYWSYKITNDEFNYHWIFRKCAIIF